MGRPRKEDTETVKEDEPKAETPDTPSGLGVKAAEGKEGDEASEAYQEAKRKARWG